LGIVRIDELRDMKEVPEYEWDGEGSQPTGTYYPSLNYEENASLSVFGEKFLKVIEEKYEK
jgi:hypothetical protein